MAGLTSADERRKKYKRLAVKLGESATGSEAIYTPKYGTETGPLTAHQEAYLKATEPKTGTMGREAPSFIKKTPVRARIDARSEIGETGTMGRVAPSQYAQTRDLAGQTFSAPTESPLRRRIKDNIVRMGETRGLNQGGDAFGPAPINRNVLQGFGYGTDPETIRFNRFLHARSTAKTPEERTAISSGFFGTKGLGEEQLETKGMALGERIRARAAENVARIRGAADIETARARPGTPSMPYRAVNVATEGGEEITRVMDQRTGQFLGQDMTELSTEMKARIDKIRNKEEFDKFFKSQDPRMRSLIKKYAETVNYDKINF